MERRRGFLRVVGAAGLGLGVAARSGAFVVNGDEVAGGVGDLAGEMGARAAGEQDPAEKILLRDYRPKSIYKIPVTHVAKAKFPIVDMHSHAYAKTAEEIAQWVRTMDEVGVAKTIILTGATGEEFAEIYGKYAKHGERFELWCGFDYAGHEQTDFGARAVRELERCHKAGARGVGELHDKGKGLSAEKVEPFGMHPDDARMDALFERCGQLGMPVNLHVADPAWMYEKMDETNDGLMNALKWRLDNQPNIVGLSGMIDILERTVKKHSGTTFIACHFANLDYDLGRLGQVLERHPNLYADIAARYGETAPIPRFAAKFYEKYQDRLVYGTDMGFEKNMYQVTFRILETWDEHFYEFEHFNYHWSLNGFGLPDGVLKKVYSGNAEKILKARKS